MSTTINTNKRIFITLISFVNFHLSAQPTAEIELYNYINEKPAFQPLAHIQTKKNWYAELRYNYEDAKTFSVYGGKTLGDDIFEITPMIGFSVGTFTGISPAFNAEINFCDLFFASQSQYSIATKKNAENFFFSWSELGYYLGKYFYTGLAMQYTKQTGLNDFQPGFMAGFHYNEKWYMPIYAFSPFSAGRYFVLGLTYEFSLSGKNLK